MQIMQLSTSDRFRRLLTVNVKRKLSFFAVIEVVAPLVLFCLAGCSSGALVREKEERRVLEQLRLVEIQLPLPPDSILARYRTYDSTSFVQRYSSRLRYVTSLIDSLNSDLPDSLRIDTLAVDYSLQDFGEAGRNRNILIVSSAYFVAYDSLSILRSIVFHEFGHLAYDRLPEPSRERFAALWHLIGRNALFYLFREGEYSGNARFGGHPEDSPAELFASAFNLLHNQTEEFFSRLRYVEAIHRGVIGEIAAMTAGSSLFLE
jgi:hypothetical protein